MSGLFPTDPKPSALEVGWTYSTLSDRTQSGRRNVREFGAHLWTFDVSYPTTLSREQAMPLIAFAMSQKGKFDSFQFTTLDLAIPLGTGVGTPLVDGPFQVGTSLLTKGWGASQTVMKAGDIFKLASNSKVYMLTEDAVTNGVGGVTLNFIPPLVTSPSHDEVLTINDVQFTVQLNNNSYSYSVGSPLLYSTQYSFLEVIQ